MHVFGAQGSACEFLYMKLGRSLIHAQDRMLRVVMLFVGVQNFFHRRNELFRVASDGIIQYWFFTCVVLFVNRLSDRAVAD